MSDDAEPVAQAEHVAVKFTRGMAPYNAGEVAGFPAERADHLVARGYATKVVLPGTPKPPVPPKGGSAPVQK